MIRKHKGVYYTPADGCAFYQDDGGNVMLDAFYADIQKYQDYTDPETGRQS